MNTHQETFYDRSMDLPDELLRGTIDLHIHAGPHLKSSPRRVDPFEAAEQAREAGMRAIVLMDVMENSAGTAWMVRRKVPGIDVFGGLILSTNHGGMNPRAVRTAMHYGTGAKFVSFGAHSTRFMAGREGRLVDGEPVPFKDLHPKFAEQEYGRAIHIPLEDPVPPALEEILAVVAEHPDVYLNTGHVSGAEALRLIELARRFGIPKVLVAHVARCDMTMAQKERAVALGAVLEVAFAEFVYPSGIPRTHYYTEREYMHNIPFDPQELLTLRDLKEELYALGPEHFILVTDYGVRAAAPPVEGMRQFIASLLDMDVPPDDIRRMTATNPARLLGLP
jgi:hypothetical protein